VNIFAASKRSFTYADMSTVATDGSSRHAAAGTGLVSSRWVEDG